MSSVVICEKPSQARKLASALGSHYGKIMAAQGHLMRLETPSELDPAWERWGFDLLIPKDGAPFGFRIDTSDGDGGKKKRATEILAALKKADRVIIATDADREGEMIGREILEFAEFRGEVLRAIFLAEDAETLRKAFDNLRPASEFDLVYEAAKARAAIDQVMGLSLTRSASLALRRQGSRDVFGIGRVRTPTLGLVCRREWSIRKFRPEKFFEISASVIGPVGEAVLWFRPSGRARIFDRSHAERIRQAAGVFSGPVSVRSEEKTAAPPKFMDLPTLQKVGSGSWGWTASRTLEVLQGLYQDHEVTTYPRSETRYMPESQAGDAGDILSGIGGIPGFEDVANQKPVIRKTHFSDRGIGSASHHAVVPNVARASGFGEIWTRLNDDERKLFGHICRTYAAALSDDHRFSETVMEIRVPSGDAETVFSVSGKVTLKAGWQSVLKPEKKPQQDDAAPEVLPHFEDGEIISVRSSEIVEKDTSPPERFDEGQLITAMQQAWRYVDDPDERERLKASKGMGTAATRAEIISSLRAQGQLVARGKKLVPSQTGEELFKVLLSATPQIADPGATARLEFDLSGIEDGRSEAENVLRVAYQATGAMIETFRDLHGGTIKLGEISPPTSKALKAAEAIARAKGIRLPAGVRDNFALCSQFIEQNKHKNNT